MKKVCILCFCLFLFVGCAIANENNTSDITEYLNSITIYELEENIHRKKDLIVYVARPICEDCEILDERFVAKIEENKSLSKILYLDISELHKNKDEWNIFKDTYGIDGTPSFLIIKDGIVVDRYGWTEKKGFDFEYFCNWIVRYV